ncbi:septum site-determining protein MinC [Zhongshania antarctica]|uniref:Probable septum site-determining protein MinC n=1 Tax=Zhongshania antarctica TaxID=641702 RepID=A0A840R1V4_9GAMM|nr:septum site-determining protein MinC [Zhongshania antarctica]MBB5186391.1 septum site-determining protein MinC [Zhongshania antarctica]
MPRLKPKASDSSAVTATFRLKGGLFPLTLLEISRFDAVDLEQQLRDKAAAAPGFFKQTPVVLSFDDFIGELSTLPLADILAICRSQGLLPVALRSGVESLTQQARALNLAIMPATRVKPAPAPLAETQTEPDEQAETGSAEASAPEPAPSASMQLELSPSSHVEINRNPSKIITTPIRSGQQVYAPGGDLIIMAAVSAGAEVLADGNIHVYGALRGRALAGVKGDLSARIFCQSLEAELVSIAGTFKVDEDLRNEHWKTAVQIGRDEQSLCITPLV